MKVMLLGSPESSHLQKWAYSLSEKGIEILIVGFANTAAGIYDGIKGIKVFSLGLDSGISALSSNSVVKLNYIRVLGRLKRLLEIHKPDILHSHYASSYGLIGALTGYSPFIISLWGSDVFDFPRRSFIHKALLKFNMKRADALLSTSRVMAIEAGKYTSKNIEITPFGIDTQIFRPDKSESSNSKITVGCIKSLESHYGLEYLIKAFAELKIKHPETGIHLRLVGDGSLRDNLISLASELGIINSVEFVGRIPYSQIASYHNSLDISVFPSIEESFGVSVLEASACEKPVIVSNVGGLPEVVDHGVTGLIIEPRNVTSLVESIETLVFDNELRNKLGKAGRKKVISEYQWDDCVENMILIYYRVLNDFEK